MPVLPLHAIDVSLDIEMQTRTFFSDGVFNNQPDVEQGAGLQPSLAISPELRWHYDDQQVVFVGFARWNDDWADADAERNHADIRELYYTSRFDTDRYGEWELLVGINKVFWGVTESVHLIDIINQTDLIEDIDGEDKLGQPSIQLATQRDWGRVELFVLPYFRERTLAGTDGRFRFALPVNHDNAQYESDRKQQHVDWALRYAHYFGNVDIGLSFFDGTSREPLFVLSDRTSQLIPFYEQMTQFGLDLQWTQDAWLWKLEALYRDASSDDFIAAVGGFEYTFFQITPAGSDLGLLLEYQYDARTAAAPITIADDDVFTGVRWALNDAVDTSVLAGIVVDVNQGTRFWNIEAERRLGNNWFIEGRLRAFTHTEADELEAAFADDDYLQVSATYYF